MEEEVGGSSVVDEIMLGTGTLIGVIDLELSCISWVLRARVEIHTRSVIHDGHRRIRGSGYCSSCWMLWPEQLPNPHDTDEDQDNANDPYFQIPHKRNLTPGTSPPPIQTSSIIHNNIHPLLHHNPIPINTFLVIPPLSILLRHRNKLNLIPIQRRIERVIVRETRSGPYRFRRRALKHPRRVAGRRLGFRVVSRRAVFAACAETRVLVAEAEV